MRLTQIKLSGFKSFVDLTTIPTPSALVGVVGPNGCGKSNIIDAVRWVLGESRASELRGASMQDVIFNGSGERKPAARASVELVFDNSLGRAAGQWSSYAEISVQRVLTRDGASSYFINKQQVRRRDIYDIFLGTGLGSKGYAIIGQGMINRLIEARPEELRVYLEEAAGVSRYKERRRETENRLRDTRENLTRLEDIISELERQLEKLQSQAKLAQQYQGLHADAELKQNALLLLREQAAVASQKKLAAAYAQEQLNLEAVLAQLSAAQTRVEQLRTDQFQANDNLHSAQARLFAASSAVSGLEAEIKHIADARQRLQSRKSQLQQQIQQWLDQLKHCADNKIELNDELELALAQQLELDEQVLAAKRGLPDLDVKLQQLHTQREQCRQQLARSEQQLALQQQAQADAKRQSQRLASKQQQLQAELQALELPAGASVEELSQNYEIAQAQYTEAQSRLLALEEDLHQYEQGLQQASALKQQQTDDLAKLQARHAALAALQNTSSDSLQGWLEQHGLADRQQLWQQIKIEQGWETALESVLRERMQAIALDSLESLALGGRSLPQADIAFYEPVPATTAASGDLQLLINLLHCNNSDLYGVLQFWLADVYAANSLSQALVLRTQQSGVFVLADGSIIDKHSIRIYKPDTAAAGQLERAQKLDNLALQIKAAQLQQTEYVGSYELALAQRNSCVQDIQQARQQLDNYLRAEHKAHLAWQNQEQQYNNMQAQRQRLQQELAAIEPALADLQQAKAIDLSALNTTIAGQQEQIKALDTQISSLASTITTAREQFYTVEKHAQAVQFDVRSIRNRIIELERNHKLAQEQEQSCRLELETLQGELFELDEDSAKYSLDEALGEKLASEENMRQARIAQEQADAELRQTDQKRMQIEQSCAPLRDKITDLQLKEQASRLTIEQYTQQLQERQVDRQKLQKHIEQQQWHNITWLQSEVQSLKRKIDALGPVNLAALSELEQAQERLGFLTAQQTDLQTAIDTLEAAIRKIDQETRSLLKDTFDQVNEHFADLFPRLFGGGKASLIMTGAEVLDAGVEVMAQPPGKRNSTINLLSGGEKALTAIALVFAFFKLNPAPFCLLDEVDAPLDDANTERYANLVKSMSAQTQFLFISHNKIAMQIAQQLIGVTMQEQGVSRIVAVDMDTALQMALPAV